MKRKVSVFTGTRSEFGLLTPVMKAIEYHPNLELSIIASGMHMLPDFGNTINLVKKQFDNVHAFPIQFKNDSASATVEGMAECSVRTKEVLEKINPDFFMLLGDRSEAYAATTAPLMMGIPIAHIHGGDRSKAGLDESFRHALTKLSNIHFAATEKSKERIIKMGENPSYAFNVGSPSIDNIVNTNLLDRKDLSVRYSLGLNSIWGLLLQHPLTTNSSSSGEEMKKTFNALLDVSSDLSHLKNKNLEIMVIYPNNDIGYEAIIQEIENYSSQFGGAGEPFHPFKNIPQIDYISFLKSINFLIGNSSSGVIEASVFPTPVINIGERQEGRERGINVIDVPHDTYQIEAAINKSLYDQTFLNYISNPKSAYGNGTAGKKIADILANIEINHNLMQKQIAY